MRIHDMKTAGNKSVQVFKSADINTDEPTCLISVDGDVNTLKSIVLKKRPQNKRSKLVKARADERPNNELGKKNLNESSIKDSTAVVSRRGIKQSGSECEFSQIIPQAGNDFKTEIKEELNTIEETAIPFVNVSIKVEPEDLTFIDQENGESSDHSNFDFASQSLNSDSDDDKPLIQRIDWKQRLNSQFGQKLEKPMDKFKHIIESAFPLVLIERLQYPAFKTSEMEIKSEENDESSTNGGYHVPQSRLNKTKTEKRQSTQNSDELTSLYKCSFCTKELKTWASLIMHEQIHRKTLDCPTCKHHCSSIIDLIRHSKENPNCSRRNIVTLTCNLCDNGVKYRSQAALNYHVTKHTGLRPFICDICNKSVRTKKSLANLNNCSLNNLIL